MQRFESRRPSNASHMNVAQEPRRTADLISRCRGSNPAAPTSQSVSNASHMKVAQKPRGTASFRRYELVSVCGIRQWSRHFFLLSPRTFFGVLVFDVLLVSSALRL